MERINLFEDEMVAILENSEETFFTVEDFSKELCFKDYKIRRVLFDLETSGIFLAKHVGLKKYYFFPNKVSHKHIKIEVIKQKILPQLDDKDCFDLSYFCGKENIPVKLVRSCMKRRYRGAYNFFKMRKKSMSLENNERGVGEKWKSL